MITVELFFLLFLDLQYLFFDHYTDTVITLK